MGLDFRLFYSLNLLPLSLVLDQTFLTQVALSDQVKTVCGPDCCLYVHLLGQDRVSIQVDSLQFGESAEAAGNACESVVRKAEEPKLLQGTNGGGQRLEQVEPQVQVLEVVEQTQLIGEAFQMVITQV